MSTLPILLLSLLAALPATPAAAPIPIPLLGGNGGIGFDDLTFVPSLGKLLVPAGRSGNLDIIDPATRQVVPVAGFSAQEKGKGGHGEGTTSADFGRGLIFAIDRTALKLVVLDAATHKVAGQAALASSPDYVRWVEPTKEVWVTQPDKERIEIFSLPASGPPVPVHKEFLSVPGGPEALIVDAARGRAYTHLWKSTTLALDLKTRAIAAQWPNSCTGSRGIALDSARGFLFIGCAEGKAVVLDLKKNGAVISSFSAGDGVDIIAFNPSLSHLYLPGGRSESMALLGVSKAGTLSLLSTVKTARGAHCVVADDHHQAWVCDPDHGQLLLVNDAHPKTE